MTHDPIANLPAEVRPFQGRRAGVVTRTLASTIDAVVVGLLVAGGYAVWAGTLFLLDPRSFTFPDTTLALNILTALTLSVLYLAACWAVTGRTYGDHLLGLRVVSARGRKLRPVTALVRAVACAFFPIGLMWCAVNRNHASVQDLFLRSRVIYDWSPRVARAAARPPAPPSRT